MLQPFFKFSFRYPTFGSSFSKTIQPFWMILFLFCRSFRIVLIGVTVVHEYYRYMVPIKVLTVAFNSDYFEISVNFTVVLLSSTGSIQRQILKTKAYSCWVFVPWFLTPVFPSDSFPPCLKPRIRFL